MPFVQRNNDGAIVGVFANKQDGFAEEELPENNSELLAFLNPPPRPRAVSPRQIRLALSQIGLRQAVEDFVNQAPLEVQDSWHYSIEFVETDPMILGAMQALNKTTNDLKALFDLAETL